MAEKTTFKMPVWPASGGMDQSSIPGTSDPGRLYDCDNVIFTVNGSRKKKWGLNNYYRSGFTPTISQNFRGMTDYWRNVSGVQTQKIVVFAGGKLWADSGDGRFSDISGTTTLVADDQVSFEAFGGYLMAFFESSVPQYWIMSGNFADLAGTPPAGSMVRVHRRRAWAAGVKTAPHRLYYSAVDDPTDWTVLGGGGSIDIDLGDNDPVGITAIFPSFFNDLYVAKRRSLYRVREITSDDLASTSFVLEPVVQGIGCLSHNAVAATPNDIIWPSERGIHSLSKTDKFGDVDAAFLSYPIHELYNEDVSFKKAKNMRAIYSPELNSYLFAYTRRGQSTNSDLLGYNIVINEWFRWQDYDCAGLTQYVDRNKKSRVLVGQEALNIGVLDSDITTDFGNSVEMYATTPLIYPTTKPDVTSDFKNIWVFFKPQDEGEFKMTYQIDNNESKTETVDMTSGGASLIGTAIIGKDVIGGSGRIKKEVIPLLGSGESIQITFSQTPSTSTADEDCDIFGFIIEGEYAEDAATSTVT